VSCVGELRELPGGQGPKGVARESGCVAWQAPLRECAHGGASTQTPGIRGTARSSGMNRNACQSASSPRDESCGSALCRRRPLPEGGGKIMANSENQMCVCRPLCITKKSDGSIVSGVFLLSAFIN
jgi:hypothetical protein